MDESDIYGIVLVKTMVNGKSYTGHARADTFTLYAVLEGFVTTGNISEILGYYPRTSSWTRPEIFYDAREAEEREYP
jgi:hypothetical protein